MEKSIQDKFINDFLSYTGLNLEELVSSLQPLAMTVPAFIERVTDIVETEITLHNPRFNKDNLTEYALAQFYRATLEQAVFMASVGDYTLVSGYEPVSNSAVDIGVLQARMFSPHAKRILKCAGLFYRGLRVKGGGYMDERRTWR